MNLAAIAPWLAPASQLLTLALWRWVWPVKVSIGVQLLTAFGYALAGKWILAFVWAALAVSWVLWLLPQREHLVKLRTEHEQWRRFVRAYFADSSQRGGES